MTGESYVIPSEVEGSRGSYLILSRPDRCWPLPSAAAVRRQPLAGARSASLDTSAPLRYQSRLEMLGAARIYFLVFGVLTIAGGVVGYFKAGSVASIVAGSISGALLLIAGFLLPEHRAPGLIIALLVSLLLAAQFIPKFIRTGKIMPAGLMALLSALGIIAAIASWLRK